MFGFFKKNDNNNNKIVLHNDITLEEIQRAYIDVQVAESWFNHADKEFCDVAISKLNFAKLYLNTVLKMAKTAR